MVNIGINDILFYLNDFNEINKKLKIVNCIKSFWTSISLIKTSNTKYIIEIKNSKYSEYVKEKNLNTFIFNKLNLVYECYNNDYYKVLMNNYIYLVIKIDQLNENNIELYDIGVFIPLCFKSNHGLLYEITIPESKMLLGLNIYMKY